MYWIGTRNGTKILRLAAAAMVMALAFAGGAWADTVTWTGGAGDGKWSSGANWNRSDGVPPKNNDDVVIPAGATITVRLSNSLVQPVTLNSLTFQGEAELKVSPPSSALTTKALRVNTGEATITSQPGGGLSFKVFDGSTAPITVGAGAVLTIAGAGISGSTSVPLKFTGPGTLRLDAPITEANALTMTGGGTLVLACEGALPNFLDGITVANGNLEVTAADVFGRTSNVTSLTITKGDLTFDAPMGDEVATVAVEDGTLRIKEGVRIGDGNNNAKVMLGAGSTAGHLVMGGDLTLSNLTTSGNSSIALPAGKTLTVRALGSGALNAAVTGAGTLRLEDDATLNKPVDKGISIDFAPSSSKTLTLGDRVEAGAVKFSNAAQALALGSNSTVGRLTLPRGPATTVTTHTDGNTIEALEVVQDAALALKGTLTVNRGLSAEDWILTLDGSTPNTELVLGSSGMLSGANVMTAGTNPVTLTPGFAVDPSSSGPVLKVKDVTLNGGDLQVSRPARWLEPLAPGGTITLFEATGDVDLDGKAIQGEPADDASTKITYDAGQKKLVLEAKQDFVPELALTVTPSGSTRTLEARVLNGVPVDANKWNCEVVAADPAGSVRVTNGTVSR